MTGFSVFHHRLGHPRCQIKDNRFRKFDLRNQREKKKRHTHKHTESGASAKDVRGGFRFKLKRTEGGEGWYFIQGPHSYSLTASTDGFAFRGRRDRSGQTKMIWNKEWSTQHTHHTILKDSSSTHLMGFKMQSNRAPWPKRNMLVKHYCYWWFEVNIKPVPRCHFVNYITEV